MTLLLLLLAILFAAAALTALQLRIEAIIYDANKSYNKVDFSDILFAYSAYVILLIALCFITYTVINLQLLP